LATPTQIKEENTMSMVIQNNLSAINANNKLRTNVIGTRKSTEKLSSGFRINRAGDDAAGLAVSEKMRTQLRGLGQAIRNTNDGISFIQTAEGALEETHAILKRIKELATQSATGTYTDDDRAFMQKEVEDLLTEMNRISSATDFNGIRMLNGSHSLTAGGTVALSASVNGLNTNMINVTGLVIQIGDRAGADTRMVVTIENMSAYALFTAQGVDVRTSTAALDTILDISDQSLAISALGGLGNAGVSEVAAIDNANNVGTIDHAIFRVSQQRANLGALQNRLEHTANSLTVTHENVTAAESQIRDTDMASEMVKYTKYSILTQAAQAMLAQANQAPQAILQLLR
jgi:flagellin